MKVTIIGGAGGMERWFACFFKKKGVEVRIGDKSDKTGEIDAFYPSLFWHYVKESWF
jgi:prephenate dehydrogenase